VRIGSLFSGIGGLELGLERAGVGQTVWQCECDDYALAVLAKHWPHAQRFRDVRAMDESTPPVDVICGGFPCQDISYAGRGDGIDGARSGLWREFARIIRTLRPRFVVVENVPALLARGLGRVLGDLAECGFDAEWDCLSASAVGAHHCRDRLWIVAYSASIGVGKGGFASRGNEPAQPVSSRDFPVGDWRKAYAERSRSGHGIPGQIHRGRALGNAVVPACAEVVGRRLMQIAESLAPKEPT